MTMTQNEILMRLEEIKFNCFEPDTHFELQDLIDDIKGKPVSSLSNNDRNNLRNLIADIVRINGLKEVHNEHAHHS